MDTPPVSYVRFRDGLVGWQSWDGAPAGAGLPMIDVGMGIMASIEDAPDEPRLSRWIEQLSGIGRLIRFDPPGTGVSDSGSVVPTLVDWAEAAVAVLDAAGVERAAVVVSGASTLVALHLIERHPDRVASLVVINGTARLLRAEDHPHGVDAAAVEGFVQAAAEPTAPTTNEAPLDLTMLAASRTDDLEFRSWWTRTARRSCTPRVAEAINREMLLTDLRTVPPTITVPTLVLARRDQPVGAGMMRALADAVPGSRYVELPGVDNVPFLGDVAGLLAEVREHLTGDRFTGIQERVFAAVLFTDLVGSTAEAVRRGDGPWRTLLLDHGSLVRSEVARHGGRLVQDLGDGTLCTFPAPGAAIRCALAMVRRSSTQLGVPMRAGIHAGEVELRGPDLAGINVHTAARVSSLAEGGEVLVSTTVVDLVAGAPFAFADRGVHELKGVPGQRQVWAVTES